MPWENSHSICFSNLQILYELGRESLSWEDNLVFVKAGVEKIASREIYFGLFLVAAGTLLYEMLITRIFSVTLWYHFAFMAISIAMFGLTCGALLVFLKPSYFTVGKAGERLSLFSWLFALSLLLAVLAHAIIQAVLSSFPLAQAWGAYTALTFPLLAMPFIFSGVVSTVALTQFPRQLGKLYACDLAGAAAGCLMLSPLLSLSDCMSSILLVAAGASFAASYFGAGGERNEAEKEPELELEAETPKSWWQQNCAQAAFITSLLLLALACAQLVMAKQNKPFLTLHYVKGKIDPQPVYQKWNSFSRIIVFGEPGVWTKPIGWGLSPKFDPSFKVRQLYLHIDGEAATVLTHFDGNLDEVRHLKFDVTNIAHNLRQNANVLVMGVGGGRDILSALAFSQKAVTGVELNQDIIDAVINKFGMFTGQLDRHPAVKIVNDEGRSYVTRSKEHYDIIQVSLIDTWAASLAGGLSLSENSLYTLESWKTLFEHLNSGGIISFSRWYDASSFEIYRLIVLANNTLRAEGIADPASHIAVIKGGRIDETLPPVATVLVCRDPFSKRDLEILSERCEKLGFELILCPGKSDSSILANLARNPDSVVPTLDVNASAPTDDSPFFFQKMPLRKLGEVLTNWHSIQIASNAIISLCWLLFIVGTMTLVCIALPFVRAASTLNLSKRKNALFTLGYFFSIGMGFMFIEISQMQRLSMFLGHPSFGLTVILFSLLLSGALGSYLVTVMKTDARAIQIRLCLLIVILALSGFAGPELIKIFQAQDTAFRVIIAVLITAPMGVFMGMAFPAGMFMATEDSDLTPWFWGINGAASVCASVLAVLLSLIFGISVAFVVGIVFYLVAFVFAALSLKVRVAENSSS